MSIYVYTSIALNYFPKARVLSTSLKRFHPDWKFCALIAEDLDEHTKAKLLEFDDIDEVLVYNQLTITDGFGRNLTDIEFKQWCFKHSITEFCTAIKGSALKYLLSKPDCEAAFYFDPDIAIFDSLMQLKNYFDNPDFSILLTPHLTTPEPTLESVWDNEICTLKHGIYNLGFVGVKNDTNGLNFANWWKNRLDMYCYADIPNGVFTDQSWCDAVPAFFDGVKILRDPQFNVATWNLSNRNVTGSDIMNLYINERYKLCFYHFSGFDSGAQLGMLNKYGKNMPKLFELRDWYINECEHLDNQEISKLKWQFNYYSNGERISDKHRIVYRTREDIQNTFINPFDANRSFSAWFETEYPHAHENQSLLFQFISKIKKTLRGLKDLKRRFFTKFLRTSDKLFKN